MEAKSAGARKKTAIVPAAIGLGMAALLACSMAVTMADSAMAKGSLLGGSKDDTAEAFTWSDDADCAKCHVKQAASESDESCLVSKHAAFDCLYCHDYASRQANDHADQSDGQKTAESETAGGESDNLSMAEVHANVTKVSTVKKSNLLKTTVPEELCLSCHDREALVEATADCTTLTDANGIVVNPHDLVEGSQHDGVTCESCHIMHVSDPMAAYRACVSCHHAEQWECGTCHSYVSGTSEGK